MCYKSNIYICQISITMEMNLNHDGNLSPSRGSFQPMARTFHSRRLQLRNSVVYFIDKEIVPRMTQQIFLSFAIYLQTQKKFLAQQRTSRDFKNKTL